jgi:hypothetical protein
MAAIIHAARKRRQGKGKAEQAQQVAAWDSSEEAEESEDEPPVWGALPAAETFLKSGWLEKKTIVVEAGLAHKCSSPWSRFLPRMCLHSSLFLLYSGMRGDEV